MSQLLRTGPLLLPFLVIGFVACSSKDTPEPSPTAAEISEPALRMTAVYTTATTVAALPTFTPTPVRAPINQPISVWVYADTQASTEDCLSLVGDMIPATAPASVSGKAVECTLDNAYHIEFYRHADGYYHLEYVRLFLLLTDDFPTPMPNAPAAEVSCSAVVQTFLPASRPASDATYVGQCAYLPPVRGTTRTETRIWARIENQLAPATLPADFPCWQSILYMGAPRDHDLDPRDVICVLEQ
jgi:hypothetical protein